MYTEFQKGPCKYFFVVFQMSVIVVLNMLHCKENQFFLNIQNM
jgi:hypothetical protein